MKAYKHIFVALVVLTLAACEKPLDYKSDQMDTQLIVNSMVVAGKPISVYVGRSVIFLNIDSPEPITDATVVIDIDGVKHKATFDPEAKRYLTEAVAKAGSTVRIEAVSKHLETAFGSVTVPTTPANIEVKNSERYKHGDSYAYDCKLYMTDNEEQEYYMIDCNEVGIMVKYEPTFGGLSDQEEWHFYTPKIEFTDAIFADNSSLNIVGEETSEGTYGPVRLFDNGVWGKRGTHTIDFRVVDNHAMDAAKLGGRVLLYRIDHNYYLYRRAMKLIDKSFPLSEPVQIPSNVEGGIGLVTAVTSAEFVWK